MNIRRACLGDVQRMMPLLNDYVQQVEILPRTEKDVYRSIREWVVAELDGKIVGMGSLLIMWHDLAEVRSLVVSPASQGYGIGRKIVNLLLEDAKILDINRVFALTRKPGFFLKIGFQLTRIEILPRKVQHDCVFCPKFHACDEVAVIMPLKSETSSTSDLSIRINQNGASPQPVIPLLAQ